MKNNRSKPKPVLYDMTFQGKSSPTIIEYLREYASISGRSLRQYFFKGLVYLNQKKAHSEAKLKTGDRIQVFGITEEYQALSPEKLPLDIIYENQELLVINKPAGMAVHPSGSITSGTLSNAVAAYFQQKQLKIKVRPVNRLDYSTSGLIIFAKTAQSQEKVSTAIQNHQIIRIYYAIVAGKPETDSGIINQPIKEIHGQRVIHPGGQMAETHFQVLERFTNASLLELNLKTGRTHQIRVHLRYLNLPILGDPQYGIQSQYIQRTALHAVKLVFTGPKINLPELIAPIPEDLKNLLTILKMSM